MVVHAFLATWSNARGTFGAGVPVSGDHFDRSGDLLPLKVAAEGASASRHWSGVAADAYGRRNSRHAAVLGVMADLDRRLGHCITESAEVIAKGRGDLDSIRDWVIASIQLLPAGPGRDEMLLPIVCSGLERLNEVIAQSNDELTSVANQLCSIGDDYASLGQGDRDVGTPRDAERQHADRVIQAVEFKEESSGIAEDPAKRRLNQTVAFSEVFGRPPESPTDWQTASILDPHSYDSASDGIRPEIAVARIEPVSGQGVVRVGQWIEQRDVISGVGEWDFGNARSADPRFDPEDTKVSTYIDFENGLVVMRQNPSVERNAEGGPGEVRVGVPEASVQQTSDGAVRIQYEAANPFAPDIGKNPPWPLDDNPWTVNGDLVFTPTQDGVRVDGTRSIYPSMEVYQDLPNGSSHTVLIDPAVTGNSTGPLLNLPRHHDIGLGGQAFQPFDTGAWNSQFDVRVPLPSTDFGPVAAAPGSPAIPLPPGVVGV